MKIQSGGKTMRNASSQQGAASKERPETSKFDVLDLQNSVAVVQNNGKAEDKKRAARANLLFC